MAPWLRTSSSPSPFSSSVPRLLFRSGSTRPPIPTHMSGIWLMLRWQLQSSLASPHYLTTLAHRHSPLYPNPDVTLNVLGITSAVSTVATVAQAAWAMAYGSSSSSTVVDIAPVTSPMPTGPSAPLMHSPPTAPTRRKSKHTKKKAPFTPAITQD